MTGNGKPEAETFAARRKKRVLVGAAAVVAVAAAGGALAITGTTPATPAEQGVQGSTVKVVRENLAAMVSVNGTLTYRAQSDGSAYSVINQARGTYTELPDLGRVVSQGQVLYRVDDDPVVLLYGSTPAYRTLSAGATGPDVAELNADLVALGYGTSAQLSPTSASFGSATAEALTRLQAALGLAQSGALSLGRAVFEPTAVRVTSMSNPLGGNAQIGQTVMQATSTIRQVDMALDASQQSEVAVGDKVTITLPDDETTPGVVSSIGTVAACPSGSAAGGSGVVSAPTGGDACSSASAGTVTTPTVTVGVTPSDPAATGTWDQAPVQIAVVTARVPSALVVPVTALLALSGGGYAVEVAGAGGNDRLVAVSLGLFDDAHGLVQVTGSALTAGQEVVVPST